MQLWNGDQRIGVDRRKKPVYIPQVGEVRVRRQFGSVLLIVGDKALEMGTPVAVKIGLELVRQGGGTLEPGDVIELNISGFEVLLLPETAMRIGGAILRKANTADDWQRDNLTPKGKLQ